MEGVQMYERRSFIIASLAALAGLLLLQAPGSVLGIELGWIGGTLLPVGIVGALYTWSRLPGEKLSFGEKRSMISLVVTVLIAAYLLNRLQAIGWSADAGNTSYRNIVSSAVVMLIAAAVLLDIFRRRERSAVLEDERDATILKEAASVSHTALIVMIGAVIVAVGFGVPTPFEGISASVIANLLIGVLILGELLRHAVELWLFRKSRP
jgi:uncharacterized membrane protein